MNSKTINYIDARNEEITEAELIALLTYQAKPYPEGWYTSGYSLIEYKNDSMDIDITEAWEQAKSDVVFFPVRSRGGAATAKYINKRSRWEQFSYPVNRWENLVCWI